MKVDGATSLPDTLENVKFSSMSWTHDNRGLFYNVSGLALTCTYKLFDSCAVTLVPVTIPDKINDKLFPSYFRNTLQVTKLTAQRPILI